MTQRDIPYGVVREINRPESQEQYLVFLDITHDYLGEPIRVVSDRKDFVLDGNTYLGAGFNITLLSDTDAVPTARLTVQNVDQRIGEALQAIDEAPRIHMQVIALSEFDRTADPRTELSVPSERIYSAPQLYLIDVTVNQIQVTGRLVSWDFAQEPYPGIFATQNRLPGLFR